jgi:hypothetical protein
VLSVSLVGYGNRLQGHDSFRFEKPAAGLEECLQKLVSDSFDHFDRNQFVKSSGQVAIVFLEDFDVLVQTFAANQVGRIFVLTVTYRSRSDMAAEVLGRVNGKTTPAASDFDDTVL